MKKAFISIVLILLLLSSVATAECKITVPGKGIVYASADVATISLGVSAKSEDVREAQASVNEALASIRKALEDRNLPKEDIITDTVNVYSSWEYSETGESLAGYYASSNLAISTQDLDSVGNLIDIAINAGANTLSGVSFSLTDDGQQQKEALQAALANARTQAEIIAEESGLVITGIEEITQQSTWSYHTDIANYREEAAGKQSSAATVIQPAKISIEASVTVIYEAKEKK